MADQVLQALAFVARRQATRTLPAGAWQNVLSLELGWMPPGQARDFVARAEAAGVLVAAEEGLRLVADPASIEIPRGFRPDPAAVPQAPPKEDAFLAWVRRVAAHRDVEQGAVLQEVSALQDEMGGFLSAEAAVLCVAQEAGLDVRDAAGAAYVKLTGLEAGQVS